MVNIKQELPPEHIYKRCVDKFGVDFFAGAVFTVGNTIYSLNKLSKDLLAHELTHVKQQALMNPNEWWDKYIDDADFRLSQELEAYRTQWEYAKNEQSRQYRKQLKPHILKTISGKMYGNMISKAEAEGLIMNI